MYDSGIGWCISFFLSRSGMCDPSLCAAHARKAAENNKSTERKAFRRRDWSVTNICFQVGAIFSRMGDEKL